MKYMNIHAQPEENHDEIKTIASDPDHEVGYMNASA